MIIVIILSLRFKEITTKRPLGVKEVRIGHPDAVRLGLAAQRYGGITFQPQAEKICLLDRALADKSVKRTVAATNAECSGRLFLDIHIKVKLVIARPFGSSDGRLFEKTKIHQILLALFDSCPAVEFPFVNPHLAA